MKTYIPIITFCFALLISINGSAQKERIPKTMFRLYEDNDFINLRGKGTDNAYTNGTRLDIFYEKNKNTHFFLNNWMPGAGSGAINTFGWGIMQLMYTPNDISKTEPDPNDFPYAGALFGIRSLHSANPVKKYSFNTELQFGLIGPLSLAKETQIAIHKLINYQRPMGWGHQLPADIVLNINFTAEKQLWQHKKWIELMGGSQIKAGTMISSLSAYSLIRIGKMNPYFDGFISRYSGSKRMGIEEKQRWQAFVIMKPRIDYQFHNSLISGGYFNKERREQIQEARRNNLNVISIPHHHILGFDYGFSLTCINNSIAITQKVESAGIRGVTHHEVGNISYYKTW